MVIAGNGTEGFCRDGGPPLAAEMNDIGGLAIDKDGNLYIADSLNFRIRRVTPASIISTYAGNGTKGRAGDGARTHAGQSLEGQMDTCW